MRTHTARPTSITCTCSSSQHALRRTHAPPHRPTPAFGLASDLKVMGLQCLCALRTFVAQDLVHVHHTRGGTSPPQTLIPDPTHHPVHRPRARTPANTLSHTSHPRAHTRARMQARAHTHRRSCRPDEEAFARLPDAPMEIVPHCCRSLESSLSSSPTRWLARGRCTRPRPAVRRVRL